MIKNNDKSIVLGIDIGGTTCKCGVVTTDGELLYKDEIRQEKMMVEVLYYQILRTTYRIC